MKLKITLQTLLSMKKNKTPVAMVTAYDFPSAVFADRAGIDVLLVGDSAAMTMLGRPNTLSVTLEEMLVFAKAVTRARPKAFVIGDMPFLSYQISNAEAVRNAGRFLAEGNCDAVKLEGGQRITKRIRAIREAAIPVMAHLGLNPQSQSLQSGYRVQGRTAHEQSELIRDAVAVEEAGASFILLEAIPEGVAGRIRKAVNVPVYGIGAGRKLDGQLLILHDILGTFVGDIQPKFTKRYVEGGKIFTQALTQYCKDIKTRQFPEETHLYSEPLKWNSESSLEKH